MPKQVWVLEDPIKKNLSRDGTSKDAPDPSLKGKSPAVAATLSLLIWGVGQFYVLEIKSGFLFVLLMANFYSIPALLIIYWNFLAPFLETFHIAGSVAFMVIAAFGLSGLIFWIFNILHAYYAADKNRTKPFEGIGHPLPVMFCSLLVPGWGQLLNGQPKKAFFFLIFAVLGFTAVTVPLSISFIWPMLVTVEDRIAVEWMIVAAVVVAPFVPLIWMIGLYDAVKVVLDPVKKEPLRSRFGYAVNRIRLKGLARGILPPIKVFLMLVLFLAFTLILVYFYFPLKNYAPILRSLEKASAERRMILTPYLLDHLRRAVSPEASFRSADPLPGSPRTPPPAPR
ncbi:MAG TPA: hypothetical protein VLY20_09005 [Nitrospiria bacterium]|nr:hypothetical protein [Nitrospiria bacterium]